MTLDLFETSWRDLWGDAANVEPVGAIFTRPEIVALMLDLAGYTAGSTRLAARRVLKSSCGDGAFLTEVVARLVASEREQASPVDWENETIHTASS